MVWPIIFWPIVFWPIVVLADRDEDAVPSDA
jgi:hypothetical protein